MVWCKRCERQPEYLVPANYHVDDPDGTSDHYVCIHCGEPIGKAADDAFRE